jgi:hypothetical protein
MYPDIDYVSLLPGASFQILEGQRIVGSGVITQRWSEEA